MITFPNAKINLGLNIVSRRPDGYHNIETVFYPIPLTDSLEIVPAEGAESTLTCYGRVVDCPTEKNLVMKAYRMMEKEFGLPPVDIYLVKHNPDGAGLGGGKQVAALEHHGDGAGLDRRGRRVAQVLNSTKHFVRKAQLVKSVQVLGPAPDGLGGAGLVGSVEGSLGHGLAGLVQNLGVRDVGYRITHMLLFLICTRYGHGMRPRERAW